jgi:protein-S-isoprenylcysteine O-methyltransferase Ste14
MKASGKHGEHPIGDVGQLILLGLFLVIWVGDSFFLKKSTFLSVSIPLYVRLTILGFSLIAAFFLIKSGHVVINHKQHPSGLILSGAFRYVRHPLYLGSILSYLGMAVATASLFSLALLIIICLFYNYIASYEEKLLEERFGEAYRSYKKKTGKWVPKIRS